MDLSGAQEIISTNRTFNPTRDIQKMDRIKRLTQTKTTYYHYIFYDYLYSMDPWKRSVHRGSLNAAEVAVPSLKVRKEVYAIDESKGGKMVAYHMWHEALMAELGLAEREVDGLGDDDHKVKKVKKSRMAHVGEMLPMGKKKSAHEASQRNNLQQGIQSLKEIEESKAKRSKIESKSMTMSVPTIHLEPLPQYSTYYPPHAYAPVLHHLPAPAYRHHVYDLSNDDDDEYRDLPLLERGKL